MTDKSNIAFHDKGDWPQALLCLVFLLIFPPVLYAMWASPEEIPWLVSAMATPFVLGGCAWFVVTIRNARSRLLEVDRKNAVITLRESRPFQERHETIAFAEIDSVHFERSDNDGYYYEAQLRLADGRGITFAQGSFEPKVQEQVERMMQALPAHIALQSYRKHGPAA